MKKPSVRGGSVTIFSFGLGQTIWVTCPRPSVNSVCFAWFLFSSEHWQAVYRCQGLKSHLVSKWEDADWAMLWELQKRFESPLMFSSWWNRRTQLHCLLQQPRWNTESDRSDWQSLRKQAKGGVRGGGIEGRRRLKKEKTNKQKNTLP